MLRELFSFFLTGFLALCNLARSFVLDSTFGITFFSFLIFGVFFKIVIALINFIKQIQVNEDKKQKEFEKSEKIRYDNWLRGNAVRRHR